MKNLTRTDQPEADEARTSTTEWKRLYLVTFAFLLIAEAILIYYGASLIAPLVLLILLVAFAKRGEKLRFVRDFGPFVLVLFAYYSMWGAADDFTNRITVMPQIDAERFLFAGHIPTIVLQDIFYNPDNPQWYDFLAVIGHISHFILPISFAAIIWQHYRHLHLYYMSSFVLLSFAGYLTFLLMPTAPPWWAADQGYIDTVYLVHETVPGLARIYSEVSANPVAAIPSLHAAMPALVFLFSLKIWGRRAWPVALYPLFMLWSIVYSGHHYVVDWLVGVAYAGGVYYALSGHPYALLMSAVKPLRQRFAVRVPEETAPERKAA